MKKLFTATALALVLTSAAHAGDMPVSKVILSTSGLAHFEHHAKVSGNANLQFPVRLEQVDDLLKSLIVFDKAGRLGGVTLPGKQPLAQVFKDLPFTQKQLSSPMLLLNAYQGAGVSVKTPSGTVAGKLVQVEAEQVVHDKGQSEKRHRISVMTDAGLKQAILEDASALQFDDEKPKAEIARALAAIRENGTQEQRTLTVALKGEGTRDVTLSYVVDAPLWKSAYRMVVPQAGGDKGLLQGWAVVENMTASDWKDVDLTLVSGNPVTFRQSLYQSYYVDRPDIPVQVFGRVMPRVDEGVVATAGEMEAARDGSAMKSKRAMIQNMAPAMGMAMPAAPPMPMVATEMAMADSAVAYGGSGGMDMVAQSANAAQSAEATTQVLFRFQDRFDLGAGQSMMVPFVSKEVPMERVSLYQPETHPRHPLAAVELKNDGDSGLPPGVLTLYEESELLKGTAFVGDAQMPVLASGEKRLVSYALDSKVTIDREDKNQNTEGKISISQGVMRTAMKNRVETVYTVKGPEKEERTVIIEHPQMGGDFKLISPDPKDVEVTNGRYRIRIALKAGEKQVVPVVLEQTYWQSYGIADMMTDQLVVYAGMTDRLDAQTRKTLEKLAEKRHGIDQVDQKLNMLENERQQIFQDQERVRENLKSLDGKSTAQEKYLQKLETQEERLADLERERLTAEAGKRKLTNEMQEMISGMEIE